MKITYTGRQVELAPAQLKKLEARFGKIGKLLDGKRECETHIILSQERHLHHAEATIHYFNHQLVGLGSNADLFTAIHSAAEKLEKQAVKTRTKWRDTKRAPKSGVEERVATPAEPEPEPEPEVERLIYHVENYKKRKPMTLDEAVLQMGDKRDYVVYRDSQTDRVVMLVRRRDGDFDLVEG
jgi:putative sigma-54 modulation protein